MTTEIEKSEIQTVGNRDSKGRFAPGNRLGKNQGRPLGVKHHLSRSFLEDLAKHWQEQGGDILRRATREDPVAVLRVIASLVPKELMLKLEGGAGGEGIVINLLGVNHPLNLRDITPETDYESEGITMINTE